MNNSCSWNKGEKKKHDDCCFSCCDEKTLVQDKVCCEFTVTEIAAFPDQLYTTNTTCADLVGVGTIKNCSLTEALTVEFVRGATTTGTGGTVIRTITISPDSCTAFTVSKFDTIRGFTPGDPIDGEICITTRYKI